MAPQVNRKQRNTRRYLRFDERIELLYTTRDKEYIPMGSRKWFWATFRALRESGWDHWKAWDFTVWALEEG